MKRKFTVCLQQYVEEVASIEVEAESAEAACEAALEVARHEQATFKWEPGDDGTRPECWAVTNAEGETIWER